MPSSQRQAGPTTTALLAELAFPSATSPAGQQLDIKRSSYKKVSRYLLGLRTQRELCRGTRAMSWMDAGEAPSVGLEFSFLIPSMGGRGRGRKRSQAEAVGRAPTLFSPFHSFISDQSSERLPQLAHRSFSLPEPQGGGSLRSWFDEGRDCHASVPRTGLARCVAHQVLRMGVESVQSLPLPLSPLAL